MISSSLADIGLIYLGLNLATLSLLTSSEIKDNKWVVGLRAVVHALFAFPVAVVLIVPEVVAAIKSYRRRSTHKGPHDHE